jgi:type IV secretion system protein VirD4
VSKVGCWRDEAACCDVVTAQYDPFFADTAELQAEALAICATCMVRDDCLTFAVRTGQQYGIWGGQPQQIVRRLIALERAGRPHSRRASASHPRPARPTANAAIASRSRTPTTPRTAIAAAEPACARPNPSEPRKEVARMWRNRDRYPEHNYVPDTFWLIVAVVLFAACGLVWLIGQVAAILFGPHHEHLPVRLVDMLGVLLRLPGTWDDPAQAWPPSSQPLLPGPIGMYAAAILTFWIPAILYGLLVRLLSPRVRRRRNQRGARWASWWQLRRLLVLGPRRGRIILGRRDRLRDRLLGRLYLAVEQCHSVLAFGPPGSFKTHGLVIPAILEWQGNLVTTSIKPDVLRATCAHRANLGAVWVYDPLGLSGVPGARWTPLAHCTTYTDARRIGRMLADAADIHGHRAEDANYWQLLGAKLLSVLLFAAAGTGRSMADVARWVDVQDVDDVATALMEIGNQQALDAWAACTSRPDNTMGSVYGTAETLLDVYGDPVIAASAEGCDLDIDELLTGANNTLYLYAPASEQERLRPLFELLVSVVIYKAEQLAAAQPGGMLDPRLFVCLDEAGNCAAIKKLPQLATTGRGQGIQLLTIWHDEAQLQHRYGHRAATVLNGHRAKLLLSGQADPASLELASKLVGDEAVTQTSETTGGDGRASLTESTAYRRLLPPEALRQLKPRRALLVYGHLPPVRIRLRPWFRSRRLVSLAMAVDAAVPHPAMAVDDLAPVQPLHQAGEDGEVAA